MGHLVQDTEGRSIATVRDDELFDKQGARVGTLRKNNVYDRNGKFIFHLQPDAAADDSAGRMTPEAVHKLFHPK